MADLWFGLLLFTLAMYVVLDGFDLGVGAIYFFVGRNAAERKLALRSIGPVWDGNEVWLLAAGGTLYFAFPKLYASGLSGFYLPLMCVFWLLILRGVAIEFRNHVSHPVWIQFWDAGFSGASLLLALFLGAALGNVVRGVALDGEGWFFAPLWTDFGVGASPGVLDGYTVSVGLLVGAALSHHGALWLAVKCEGPLQERAKRAARAGRWVIFFLTALVTGLTLWVQPKVAQNLARWPAGFLIPGAAMLGLYGSRWRRGEGKAAFLASCLYLTGMLASAAFGIYPQLLPSVTDEALSLTVSNTAAAPGGLRAATFWWIPGMVLAGGYFVYTYRRFRGKVSLEENGY